MERQDAQSALGSIGDAQAQLASAVECPPWRHALFGLIMASLVLGLGLDRPIQWILLAASLAMTALTVVADRRRMGVFANGYRRGATLPVALGILAVTLALVIVQIRLREADAAMAFRLATAAAEFVLATLASVLWQNRFRAELLKGRA